MGHILWSCGRCSAMPILYLKGESDSKYYKDHLIRDAVRLIEASSEFKAHVLQNGPPNFITYSSPITVIFSVIFPEERYLEKFIQYFEDDFN